MKYRLKKDLPWANKGQIIYADEAVVGGWTAWSIRDEDDKKLGVVTMNSRTFYEWFEEVDERWKPKLDVMQCRINQQGEVLSFLWGNHFDDEKRYEFGNCFRTPELAKKASEQIKALLKEFHKNNP